MKHLALRRPALAVALLLILSMLTLALAACAPDAQGAIISPRLGEQLAAAEAGQVVVAAAAEELPKLAELSTEAIFAGLPADFADALAAANPDNGTNIALTSGCIGCHNLDPTVQMTGPTWHNVGDTAVSRVPAESPALYLYHSIVDPNLYVVPNYPANIMPQTYADTLSQEQLADLVAYLLAQNGQP